MIITNNNYKNVISNNNVVIKFGAEWCGPCKVIEPIIKKLEAESQDPIIGICDIDVSDEVGISYSIRNVPTILFFKDGEVVSKHVGVITEAKLREMLTSVYDTK